MVQCVLCHSLQFPSLFVAIFYRIRFTKLTFSGIRPIYSILHYENGQFHHNNQISLYHISLSNFILLFTGVCQLPSHIVSLYFSAMFTKQQIVLHLNNFKCKSWQLLDSSSDSPSPKKKLFLKLPPTKNVTGQQSKNWIFIDFLCEIIPQQ